MFETKLVECVGQTTVSYVGVIINQRFSEDLLIIYVLHRKASHGIHTCVKIRWCNFVRSSAGWIVKCRD